MLYGVVMKDNGWYTIRVEDFPYRRYLYYSRREAISRYVSNGIAAIRHCGTSASFWHSAAMSGSPTLAKGSLSRQSVRDGEYTGGRSCSDSAVSLPQPV